MVCLDYVGPIHGKDCGSGRASGVKLDPNPVDTVESRSGDARAHRHTLTRNGRAESTRQDTAWKKAEFEERKEKGRSA